MVGYDYVISLEHEDGMMSFDEGVSKGLAALRDVVTVETPGDMFWA
jgi:sugar phosphate isomerase/epimerase